MKTTIKEAPARKHLAPWVHYVIIFGVLLSIFAGFVLGWYARSNNQAQVNSQASALVQTLKSQK